jgi:hypothetical protein
LSRQWTRQPLQKNLFSDLSRALFGHHLREESSRLRFARILCLLKTRGKRIGLCAIMRDRGR